jgi:hypothetical protein
MDEQPIRYVTYLDNLNLDGCYFQVPLKEHEGRMIEVSQEIAESWVYYKVNAGRDGVEFIQESVNTSPVVPHQVTMRQARLALLQIGKLSAVDASIDALPSPDKEVARIEWEFSSTVERNRDITNAIAYALGMSEQELDSLFIAASEL